MGLSTPEQLCNIALLRVGERQVISSLTEASAAARACNVLYGPARDTVLESFPWPFGEREKTLGVLSDATAIGFEFVYALPSDCIRPNYLWSGIRNPPPELRPTFKRVLADDPAGSPNIPAIATDKEDAILVYTSAITKVSLFSPLFIEALAWKLASDLALTLPVKPGVAKVMFDSYILAWRNAGAAMLNQAQGDQPTESEQIRERG